MKELKGYDSWLYKQVPDLNPEPDDDDEYDSQMDRCYEEMESGLTTTDYNY